MYVHQPFLTKYPVIYSNSTGYFVKFLAALKIHKKSNFDRNQLKLSKQHKNMYMYQEKL